MPLSRLLAVLLAVVLLGCRPIAPADPVPPVPVVLTADTTGLDPLVGEHGMVVSGQADASRVGAEILRQGGNAVDAAVATAFALAVTLPYAGNVGGGGFIVLRFPDGRATTIDFRETAPAGATRDMFLDEEGYPDRRLSTTHHLASGVPGSPAGLLLALERYGTLDRAAVLDPAIRLAEEGFRLTRRQAGEMNRYRGVFLSFPGSARHFVKPDSSDFLPEELFRQPELAETLRRIRDDGRDGFYRGRTADLIVAEMERGGGLITHADLAAYEPVERPALEGDYRGHRVITMGPPSSGGVALLQMLYAVEPVDLGAYGFQSPRAVHRMGEAMRRAYADRAVWLGDPDFVEVPLAGLLSKGYVRSRMASFNPERTTPSARVQAGTPAGAPGREAVHGREGTETTHLSAVDPAGMAVSLTTTINDLYGSKVAVEGAGFLLNNEMDDFTAAPGVPNIWGSVTGEANAVAPRKRMLSSMTPTIVEDPGGRLLLVVGTPGGTTIPTTVYQVVTSVLDFGLPLQRAVEAPRFHHQWDPDRLFYEQGFGEPLADSLRQRGWETSRRGGSSGAVGAILVEETPAGRRLTGAFDPRRDVVPSGW